MKTLIKAIVMILSLLFILELSIRLFFPQDISPVIGVLDPLLGYQLQPNATGIHKTREFYYPIKINSQGLRSPDTNYTKSNNSLRIMFLGDSYTYGWGVADEERFSNIVGNTLPIEFVNAGVPGYKLSNILSYFEHEGYKYSPDIVVLVYTLNTGTVNIDSEAYSVVNHSLVRKNLYTPSTKNKFKAYATHIPFYSFLVQHSQLFAFVRNLMLTFVQKPLSVYSYNNCSSREETWHNLTRERELLILKEFEKNAPLYNFTVYLVINPSQFCNLISAIEDIKTSVTIPIIDLSPYFVQNSSRYYYPYDGHWNKEGHALAAKILISYLNTTFNASTRSH